MRGSVALEGVGLHTGRPVRVRLAPGAPDSGIVFSRDDLPGRPVIRATLAAVRDVARGVTLGDGAGETVGTVEHLLSAAAGLTIDNLVVAVEGPELPALDGSAAGFVQALLDAMPVDQDAAAPVIVLGAAAVTLGDGDARTTPAPALTVTYRVDLPPPLGVQTASYVQDRDPYPSAIAPARTWGFAAEAAALRARGLARGAGWDNVLVIGGEGYLTPPRFADEPARHKILDLLGDLALLGARLHGAVRVTRGGHALHVALARQIAQAAEEVRHG